MTARTLVQTRIDSATKEEAAAVLKGMGLTVSDAVRLLLLRIAREKTLPFDPRTPNRETQEAMAEVEAGGRKSVSSVEALFAELNADD